VAHFSQHAPAAFGAISTFPVEDTYPFGLSFISFKLLQHGFLDLVEQTSGPLLTTPAGSLTTLTIALPTASMATKAVVKRASFDVITDYQETIRRTGGKPEVW